MSLDSWLQNGYLLKHQATVAEVQKLLGQGERTKFRLNYCGGVDLDN
jgi:hypothetical protein